MKKKIFKYLFIFGLFCCVIGFIGVCGVFMYYSFNLPKHTKLEDYQPPITSRLYSSDGVLLKEYANEKRLFTAIENIPDIVKFAFISAEDRNFYTNKGIDLEALTSAMIYNVFAYFKGGQFRGGSTITQQVVKNMLLTNERTIERKIKEAILSLRITKDFEKDKILELYLNHIYLGNNAYGVASATLSYFNKSLNDITIEESALLAAMPKAPGKLNPVINYDGALARRNWVIERMYKNGYITKEEMLTAQETPINIIKREKDKYFNYGAFVEEVRKGLLDKYSEDSLMRDGFVVSTTLNPTIQKSLDKALKNGLESYDKRHGYRGALGNIADSEDFETIWPKKLKDFEIKEYFRDNWQRAVVLNLDVENEKVIIGLLKNEDIQDFAFDELIEIDGVSAKKSFLMLKYIKWAVEPSLLNMTTVDEEGNEIKVEYKVETVNDINLKVGDVIFVENTKTSGYLLKQTPIVNGGAVAMDPHTGRILGMVGGYIDSEVNFNRATQAKRQPGSVIKPFIYLSAFENGYSPVDTIMDEEIVLPQGLGVPNYRPKNFADKYYGLVTLRTALQNSYNVSTVRLVSQIGIPKATEVIRRFEINKRPKGVYSVVLGSVESYLINMVKAYSMIVNGGKYINIETIEKVQDKNGATIFKRDDRKCSKCNVYEENINEVEVPFLEDNRKTITDPASAYQITSILEGVVKYGTAWRARGIGKIIGGKTGTSNGFRDAWFIGFSPDLVVGVYVGFDDNRTLGENETGSRAALPIFIEAMKEILKNEPSIPFRIPQNIVLKRIDASTGQTPTLISQEKNIIMEAFKTDQNTNESDVVFEFREKQNENEISVVENPTINENDFNVIQHNTENVNNEINIENNSIESVDAVKENVILNEYNEFDININGVDGVDNFNNSNGVNGVNNNVNNTNNLDNSVNSGFLEDIDDSNNNSTESFTDLIF